MPSVISGEDLPVEIIGGDNTQTILLVKNKAGDVVFEVKGDGTGTSPGGGGGLQPGETLTQIVGDDGGVGYSSPDNVPVFAFRVDGDAFDRLRIWSDGRMDIGNGLIDPSQGLRITGDGANGRAFFYAGAHRINLDGTGLSFFGHAPVAQQATPVTLADVIALLQAYGLSA